MTTAIIIGSAKSVYDDLAEATALVVPDFVVAVNHAGIEFERVDHWATCHVDDFPTWLAERRAKGYADPALWTDDAKPASLPAPLNSMGIRFAPYAEGSSGELGISVALVLGADRIIGCGMPLENGPHFYEGDDFSWDAAYQSNWKQIIPTWQDRVRFMSGWSAQAVGKPTKAWLKPLAKG